jgi:hypothetical protein
MTETMTEEREALDRKIGERAFLNAVEQGDPGFIGCSYGDAKLVCEEAGERSGKDDPDAAINLRLHEFLVGILEDYDRTLNEQGEDPEQIVEDGREDEFTIDFMIMDTTLIRQWFVLSQIVLRCF